MLPHPQNFCGGNFQDWLEVNLLSECNGRCSWCIERRGYHPTYRATWQQLCDAALATGKENIILLGGEPLLYKDLGKLIAALAEAGRKVWVTTNGALLRKRLGALSCGVAGVNISIHHYNLALNEKIVGVKLKERTLSWNIKRLHDSCVRVRFNCNLIAGYIDSVQDIHDYIEFARRMGADNVRFAELKLDSGFVDAAKLFNNQFELTNDPFTNGCNHDVEIDGMPVNFRQMCGLQTLHRVRPKNPIQCDGLVLYYDGHLYNGWQCPGYLDDYAKSNVLKDLASGKISTERAIQLFDGSE